MGKGGKDLSRERGGKILGRKRRRSGGKEGVEKILGRKGGGEGGGKDVSRERRGKIFGRKGRRSGGKGLRGERGEMTSTRKGWKKS